jgi:sec-independent protein translocase protein TatA
MAMVFVIALLVFGPKRLPELGRQVGKGLRELKRQMNAVSEDVRGAIDDTHQDHAATVAPGPPPPAPSPPSDTPEESEDDLLAGVVVSGATGPIPPNAEP